ncbi:hypothetical protein AQJ23_24375 [Streptomyces antibioticus]|nr:hypothetical protein AQJ23_24375 [Streptomyces antibioticus]
MTVSVGAALVLTLTACGGSDTDGPADPPGVVYDDPTGESTDTPYDEPAGEYEESTGDYDDSYTDPSYGVPEGDVPDEGVPGGSGSDYWEHEQLERDLGVDGQGLLDGGMDNFERNMGNYQGW